MASLAGTPRHRPSIGILNHTIRTSQACSAKGHLPARPAVTRGDGSYGRLLAKLAKLDLLAIDDWLLAPLTVVERRYLLKVLEDRSEPEQLANTSSSPAHGL